jgi:predicted nucleotidyltransferase
MEKAKVEEKIKQVVDKIVKEYQPEKIILFGSWAWGEPGPDSDIDLLIIKESQKSRMERERDIETLLHKREIPLDLLVYTPEELTKSIHENYNLFVEDIIRNGKVLYVKPESDIIIPLPQRELAIA